MSKKQTKQVVLVVAMAIAVVVLSILLTLFVRNPEFSVSLLGGGGASYQRPISLGEAQMVCEDYTRKTLASRLVRLSVDSHSTRTEGSEHLIYFDASLYPEEGGAAPEDFFVNCAVYLGRAEVSRFELAKDEELKTRAVRATKGNAFGM